MSFSVAQVRHKTFVTVIYLLKSLLYSKNYIECSNNWTRARLLFWCPRPLYSFALIFLPFISDLSSRYSDSCILFFYSFDYWKHQLKVYKFLSTTCPHKTTFSPLADFKALAWRAISHVYGTDVLICLFPGSQSAPVAARSKLYICYMFDNCNLYDDTLQVVDFWIGYPSPSSSLRLEGRDQKHSLTLLVSSGPHGCSWAESRGPYVSRNLPQLN